MERENDREKMTGKTAQERLIYIPQE